MIQIENTPNPNALKFLSENTISEIGSKEFQKNEIEKTDNYFIKNLLKIDGVELILLSDNFISVKKTEKASWESIKPSVIACLNDYFQSNKKPILKKEDKQLLIASHNAGKVREMTELLIPFEIKVIKAEELDLEEPEETGKSFKIIVNLIYGRRT